MKTITIRITEGIQKVLDQVLIDNPLINKSALIREALNVGLCTILVQKTVDMSKIQIMKLEEKK